MNELHISKRFGTWKRDSWAQNINLIVGHHCPYLTFRTLKTLFVNINKTTLLQDGTAIIWTSTPVNSIPDIQQIDPLAVVHIPDLNVLQLENRIREY